ARGERLAEVRERGMPAGLQADGRGRARGVDRGEDGLRLGERGGERFLDDDRLSARAGFLDDLAADAARRRDDGDVYALAGEERAPFAAVRHPGEAEARDGRDRRGVRAGGRAGAGDGDADLVWRGRWHGREE